MHGPLSFPADIDATSSSAPLEAATALRLRDGLPDDWWVIHACHWTLPKGRHIGQGEVDFVVVSPGGSIGLMSKRMAWSPSRARSTSSTGLPQVGGPADGAQPRCGDEEVGRCAPPGARGGVDPVRA